ncbi:lysophospholipase L1-like esterase [Geodermatophilus bullaregiensis]|uniref:GDSL-type esterase/lipase family protein n=1 Tax=Geodermatophilus bullaregiensis TaxID=1564160 RepID=UPI00195CB938|nr:GDSL-type esterase/lipase family protein [Geodermatophilus bullaregiensis]MBM7808705.1 lysophospholipase L1-like esterase [Geodermatophilus bullaregiensis]
MTAPLRLVVLGDSIAYGTGAARVEDTLGSRLAQVLRSEGLDVDLTVLAVPGAVSRDLTAQVRRATVPPPDLAVVVVGANDLARFVPAEQAAAALGAAVSELRALGSDVVVVPAPDMSSVPFVPPAFRPAVQAACALLQRRQAAVAGAHGATVAAVSAEVGRAFSDDPALFSADRFHPSSAGYARIAAALAPTVLAVARARRARRAA